MGKFHPFYFIGSIGMMITGTLHMFFSLALSISPHSTFFVLYCLFFVFLVIGVALTAKAQKPLKEPE